MLRLQTKHDKAIGSPGVLVEAINEDEKHSDFGALIGNLLLIQHPRDHIFWNHLLEHGIPLAATGPKERAENPKTELLKKGRVNEK